MSLHKRAASWLLGLSLIVLGLGCGLTDLLRATPAPLEITATDTPTVTPSSPAQAPSETPTPTETPPPAPPSAPTETPTVESPPSEPTATNTSAPPPPPTDTVAPTPTETPPGLRIESFDVEMTDAAGGGKTIRCTWDTSGASSVRIVLGTHQRFPVWQDGDPDGTLTFEATETLYRNPNVIITARGISGGEATETVTLAWLCDHRYFFAAAFTGPRICPAAAGLTIHGAQQPFQGGVMMWVPGIEGNDWIYVLYNDNAWQRYEDTWHEGLPESDPTIIPPSGYLQPIRGFGKVWREHSDVQSRLNWATIGESAVDITFQRQMQESIGGVQYLRSAGAAVVRLDGIGGSGSTWSSLP